MTEPIPKRAKSESPRRRAVNVVAKAIAKTVDPRAEWDKHWSNESRARFMEMADAAVAELQREGWHFR